MNTFIQPLVLLSCLILLSIESYAEPTLQTSTLDISTSNPAVAIWHSLNEEILPQPRKPSQQKSIHFHRRGAVGSQTQSSDGQDAGNTGNHVALVPPPVLISYEPTEKAKQPKDANGLTPSRPSMKRLQRRSAVKNALNKSWQFSKDVTKIILASLAGISLMAVVSLSILGLVHVAGWAPWAVIVGVIVAVIMGSFAFSLPFHYLGEYGGVSDNSLIYVGMAACSCISYCKLKI